MAASAAMKLATLRRRAETMPGVSGVARLDRRATRLAGRLNPGDIAVIDHVDLDRITAEALVRAKPAAVLNARPSISGRYPNLGPELIIASGIVLVDNVGAEVFAVIKEGTRIRVVGDSVFVGENELLTGTAQDTGSIEALMLEAKRGLSSQLEAFAADTGEFLGRERSLLLEGVGIPKIKTRLTRRHVVVVVGGPRASAELKSLKHYIREFKPVLVGVDGGADALTDAGYRPQLIVGDMEAVSDTSLTCGAEVVVRSQSGTRAPGLLRAQDLGVAAITFATTCTSEDAALLLADEHRAEVVVSVGSHHDITEFLDRGRAGMASTFLTRLRLGSRLVDARSASSLYRSRISAAALLVLVIAAFVAIVAALAVSDTGRTYLSGLSGDWNHLVNSVKDAFS